MFALLSTCDRPAVDPRKTPEGIEEREILIIRHFFLGGRIWRSKTEPVNQQFSKTYTYACARVYLQKVPVHWFSGSPVHPSVGGEAGCDCGRVSKQSLFAIVSIQKRNFSSPCQPCGGLHQKLHLLIDSTPLRVLQKQNGYVQKMQTRYSRNSPKIPISTVYLVGKNIEKKEFINNTYVEKCRAEA